MIAVFDEQTEMYRLMDGDEPIPNMGMFKQFVGGIGWPVANRPHHYRHYWVCVFGVQEDGVVVQVGEAAGSLIGLCKHATNLKDRFCVERFYCDDAEVNNQKVRALRHHEGLTFYTCEKQVRGYKWLTDTKTWPHFRNHNQKAAVIGVIDDIKIDLESGFQNICTAAGQGKLSFTRSCLRLPPLIREWSVERRKPEDTLEHPLVSAAVFAFSQIRPVTYRKTAQANEPVYLNI